MPYEPVVVTYGTLPVLRARMLHVSGGTPSQCWLTSQRSDTYPTQGDLVWQQGGTAVVFRDCRIKDTYTLESGPVVQWRHVIEDRRWRWQGIQVGGDYNIRKPSGLISNKKSAYELFELLLRALGETGYNISNVPTDVYPTMRWSDIPVPYALDQLALRTNCRVSLRLDNTVEVIRKVPASVPSLFLAKWQIISTRHRKPRFLVLRFEPTVFESRLMFEAMGVEPIDAAQPYKWQRLVPVRDIVNYAELVRFKIRNGVYSRCPLSFKADEGGLDHWLWKMWRVVLKHPLLPYYTLTTVPTTTEPLLAIEQIELMNEQAYIVPPLIDFGPSFAAGLATSDEIDDPHGLPGVVTPGYSPLRLAYHGHVPANLPQVTSVDGQMLYTDRPYYKVTTTQQQDESPEAYITEPLMQVHCTFRARDQFGRYIRRPDEVVDLGGIDTTTKLVPLDLFQISREHTVYMGENTGFGNFVGPFNNDADIQSEFTAIRSAEIAAIGTGESWDVAYVGLAPINIDAVVAQVQWSSGASEPGFTRVGLNEEFDETYPNDILRLENHFLRESVR